MLSFFLDKKSMNCNSTIHPWNKLEDVRMEGGESSRDLIHLIRFGLIMVFKIKSISIQTCLKLNLHHDQVFIHLLLVFCFYWTCTLSCGVCARAPVCGGGHLTLMRTPYIWYCMTCYSNSLLIRFLIYNYLWMALANNINLFYIKIIICHTKVWYLCI